VRLRLETQLSTARPNGTDYASHRNKRRNRENGDAHLRDGHPKKCSVDVKALATAFEEDGNDIREWKVLKQIRDPWRAR
jgi:hypothetical protein